MATEQEKVEAINSTISTLTSNKEVVVDCKDKLSDMGSFGTAVVLSKTIQQINDAIKSLKTHQKLIERNYKMQE